MGILSGWQNPLINPWPEEQKAIRIGEAKFLFNSLFLPTVNAMKIGGYYWTTIIYQGVAPITVLVEEMVTLF